MKKSGDTHRQTHTHTDDTHPSQTIVPDGIYSVGDKNPSEAHDMNIRGGKPEMNSLYPEVLGTKSWVPKINISIFRRFAAENLTFTPKKLSKTLRL